MFYTALKLSKLSSEKAIRMLMKTQFMYRCVDHVCVVHVLKEKCNQDLAFTWKYLAEVLSPSSLSWFWTSAI